MSSEVIIREYTVSIMELNRESLKKYINIKFSKGVWLIALWGLFMGLTTTMIYSQLGMFLKHELHASALKIALLDGFVELLSNLTRIFAGVLSDFMMNRKAILLFGCIFSILIKPLFVMAHSVYTVLIAQSLDRISNGIQATPRDALIADVSSPKTISSAYGLTRSFKTIGAFLGTFTAAMLLLHVCNGDYRTMFMFAFIPAILAVLVLMRVQEPAQLKNTEKFKNPFTKQNIKSLNATYWRILFFAFLFEMSHFSDALLAVRANDFLEPIKASIATIAMNIGQLSFAYPIGLFADKFGKKKFILVCIFLMLIANVLLLAAQNGVWVFIGAFFWGAQMSSVIGLFLALIRDAVVPNLRGTAIGLYYTIVGVGYVLASLVAGDLWKSYGCKYAFAYSIIVCLICLLTFNLILKDNKE